MFLDEGAFDVDDVDTGFNKMKMTNSSRKCVFYSILSMHLVVSFLSFSRIFQCDCLVVCFCMFIFICPYGSCLE